MKKYLQILIKLIFSFSLFTGHAVSTPIDITIGASNYYPLQIMYGDFRGNGTVQMYMKNIENDLYPYKISFVRMIQKRQNFSLRKKVRFCTILGSFGPNKGDKYD